MNRKCFSLAEISVYCHLGKKLKKRNQRWYLWIRLVKCNYLILHWPFYLIAFTLGSHIFSNLGCSQLSGKLFPSLRFCRQHKPADVDPFHKLSTYVRGNQSWISSERTLLISCCVTLNKQYSQNILPTYCKVYLEMTFSLQQPSLFI